MRTKTFSSTIEIHDDDSGLSEKDRELLNEAREAASKAYAPYSEFFVGASVRLANGKIISGNNQENVAFPSGLCAERVAVFSASANFPNEKMEAIAVSCHSEKISSNQPFSPCGACRQSLLEYENKQQKNIRIILGGKSGEIFVIKSVKDLLPLAFEAGLKK